MCAATQNILSLKKLPLKVTNSSTENIFVNCMQVTSDVAEQFWIIVPHKTECGFLVITSAKEVRFLPVLVS